MGYISVTNQFSNSTIANAPDVNTNFSDIINGLKDGTKDINLANIAVTGTLTATAINLPVGNTVAAGMVKSGYSYVSLFAAGTNYTNDFTPLISNSAPSIVGTGVVTCLGGGEELRITAVQKCIVTVTFDINIASLDMYKVSAIVAHATKVSYNCCLNSTVYLAPGEYLFFMSTDAIGSDDTHFNATAIQVN